MKLKKSKTGNLRVVKTAGFKVDKKSKNINKRAGLAKNKKSEEGETLVKRRKPLALKHVRRMRKAALAFSCVLVAIVSYLGVGFFVKPPVEDLPAADYATVCYEAPKDGSAPTDYSIVENIGFLNYTLQNQLFWSTEMQSTVSTVMEQKVEAYKQYYNGVLISAEISQGFSSEAKQFCVVDGIVLWRTSANKKFNGMNTEWSTKKPDGMTVQQFKQQRGLPPSEFSAYVLNENTIKNAYDLSVTNNGDGTFTMSVELNVNMSDGIKAADYYYKQQMYVTGGLSDRPVIDWTTLTYTFDSNWRVLEYTIEDAYTVKIGVLNPPCSSYSKTVYFYEEEKAYNTFYEDYFEKYKDNFVEASTPEINEPSAVNFLASAFGSVLDEGATFKLKLGIDKLDMDGVVHIGFTDGALNDIRVALGDISVFTGENNLLYISDGNAKYSLDISAFSGVSFAEDGASSLDLNALLDDLMSGEFVVTETNASLTSNLELFGLKINLHIAFEISGDAVALDYASAEIPLGNTAIKALVRFGTEEDIPQKPEDMSGYTDILGEGLTLETVVSIDDLKLSGLVKLIMSDGAFKGVYANLGDISVLYDCPTDMLYLSDGKSKIKFSLESIGSVNLSSFPLDTNSLIAQIIESLSAADGSVSVNATLDILGQTISAALAVKLTGGIGVNAETEIWGHKIAASVGLSAKEAQLPDLDEYKDILNEGVSLDAELTIDEFKLSGLVYIGLSEGKLTEVRADFGDIAVYFINNAIYVTDGVVKYTIALPESSNYSINASGLDIESLIRGIVFADGKISANLTLDDVLGEKIEALLEIGLFGGLNVNGSVNAFGKTITLTAEISNEMPELPDLGEYIDVLNEGVTLDVSVVIDETGNLGDGAIELNGNVFLGLEEGKFTELRADFGEIALYYKTTEQYLYIKLGTVKYKININGMDTGANLNFAELLPEGYSAMIGEILNNIVAGLKEISIRLDIGILDAFVPVSAVLNIENGLSAFVSAELFGVRVCATVGLSATEVSAIEDKDDYIDVINDIWGAVESVIGNSFAAEVSGSMYSYDNSKYAQYGYVKYNFTAALEYDFEKVYDENGNLKPAVNINTGHVNEDGIREGVKFSVDSEVYLHFNLNLVATSALDDSFNLDVVIMDANPVTDGNGFTTGGYTKDGVLDVYVSVSQYSPDSSKYDPLKIYAPVDEIMTLLAMVGSAANLDKLSFENEELNAAVSEISGIIDSLLIENYIPYTKDEFASLGESLIPQILGVSLQEYIDKIISSLTSDVSSVTEKTQKDSNNKFVISDGYVNDISCGGDSLKITLDSSLIYNKDMSKEDYLVVELNKAKFSDGVDRLTDISLKNVYFGENNFNELDLALNLRYSGIQRPSDTEGLYGYVNFEGVDTLLKAFVNSATHQTENGETEYELNDYYLLNGIVNVKISVIGINIGVDVNIESLSIRIDENNKVSVDAHISYEGVQELNQIAINGDTDLYLSIRGDMIYLKRVQKTYWEKTLFITSEKTYATPMVEYRVMPLSSFAADIMNQINFMFNFGSLVADQLGSLDMSGSGSDATVRDLGATLKYILAYYRYTESETSASWTVAINSQFLTDMVGMTMTDIPVTINADKNSDGTYTVTGLDISESTMKLIGSVVTLKFSGSMRYCNPNETENHGYTDSSLALDESALSELNGLSWNKVLGGNTFKDIEKNINWELLTADTNLKYLSYGNGSPLGVAPFKYLYSTDGGNTQFAQWGETVTALYNSATGNVYTNISTPDLAAIMPKVENKTAVWKSEYEFEDGALVLRAIYDTTYKVTVDSIYPTDDDYVYDNDGGVWNTTVEEAYGKVLLPVNVYYTDNAYNVYGLKYYVDESGNKCSFDKYAYNAYGELCFVADVYGDMHYTAVWERVYEVKFVAEFDGTVHEIYRYYYVDDVISENLPEVPRVGGYTGEWIVPEDATVTPDSEYIFYAEYNIISYEVNVVSSQAVSNDGFTAVDGVYVNSEKYVYATKVTLENLSPVSGVYSFSGFYDNPEFRGVPVTEFFVTDNVTYYAKWEGKAVNVTYKSDLPFGNAKLGDDGFYSFSVSMHYGDGDNLANYEKDGYIFLGGYTQNANAYNYVASADELKSGLESLAEVSESVDVTLWAVWAEGVTVTVDSFSKGGIFNRQYSLSGYVSLVYASDFNAEIARIAGITHTSVVEFCLAFNNSGSIDDRLNKVTVNGDGTFNFKNESCGNAIGKKNLQGIADVNTTIKCGSVELANISVEEKSSNIVTL